MNIEPINIGTGKDKTDAIVLQETGISKTPTKCSADFDPHSGLPVFNALPTHKPDGTRRPEFAINLRIPTFEALLAEIDVMLLAFIGGVDFRMTGTFAHGQPLSNR